VASGEALVVLAHQERAARYRLNHVTTGQRQPARRWRLDGRQVRGAGRRRGRRLHRAGAHGARRRTGIACSWSSGCAAQVRGYPTQDGARAAD
jgi:hypothetical protein